MVAQQPDRARIWTDTDAYSKLGMLAFKIGPRGPISARAMKK